MDLTNLDFVNIAKGLSSKLNKSWQPQEIIAYTFHVIYTILVKLDERGLCELDQTTKSHLTYMESLGTNISKLGLKAIDAWFEYVSIKILTKHEKEILANSENLEKFIRDDLSIKYKQKMEQTSIQLMESSAKTLEKKIKKKKRKILALRENSNRLLEENHELWKHKFEVSFLKDDNFKAVLRKVKTNKILENDSLDVILKKITLEFKCLYLETKKYRDIAQAKEEQYYLAINELEKMKQLLNGLPNNPIYIEYEKKKIEEIKAEYYLLLMEVHRNYDHAIKKLSEKIDLRQKKMKEYHESLENKERRILTITESLRNNEIIKLDEFQTNTQYNKMIEELGHVNSLKTNAYKAIEEMRTSVEEMQEEVSQEYPLFMYKMEEAQTPKAFIDFYKYLKFRKYNASRDSKTIKKHLNCDNCKKLLSNDCFAGYKISPSLLDFLQKSGIEKIVLFDIKNCCNDIEKIVVKALSKIKKYHGGKSSIWYRNFLADKYYTYDKKIIDNKFYYTFLADKISQKPVEYNNFKAETNKKFVYHKYYRKLDREAGLKLSLYSLSKEEIKHKNKMDNDKYKKLTDKYCKLFFYKGFKMKTAEEVEENTKCISVYKKSKHFRQKRPNIVRQMRKHDFIPREDFLKHLATKEEKGEIIPYIEKVGYDLAAYQETLENIHRTILSYPVVTISDNVLGAVFPNYIKEKSKAADIHVIHDEYKTWEDF